MTSSLACSAALSLVGKRDAIEAMKADYLQDLAAFDSVLGYRAEGFVSMETFLASWARLAPAEAAQEVALARRLYGSVPNAMPAVAALISSGEVTLGQAQEIAAATRSMDPVMFGEIEQEMAAAARRLLPGHIARVADKIKAEQLRDRKRTDEAATKSAADAASAAQARVVEAERVQQEFDSRYVRRRDVGRMTFIEAFLTRTDADIVMSVLGPLSSPRVDACREDHQPEERSYAQRLADAFVDMARRFQALDYKDFVPGPSAHIQVIVTLDELLTRTGIDPRICCGADVSVTLVSTIDRSAPLDSGPGAILTPRSQLDLGRLEEALYKIAPALGGNGFDILEQGRTRRLATNAQRRALKVRDRGCVYPGCSRPWEWTEAHHSTEWIDGGETNLDDLASLCSPHHQLIHAKEWEIERDGHGGWRIRRE